VVSLPLLPIALSCSCLSGPGRPLRCSQSSQSTVGIPPAIHPTSSCSRGWVQVVYRLLSVTWGVFVVVQCVVTSSCRAFLVEEVIRLSVTWHRLGRRQVLTGGHLPSRVSRHFSAVAYAPSVSSVHPEGLTSCGGG
jgi:hypothetical protein